MELRCFIDTPRLGERAERHAAHSVVLRWTLRLCLTIIGVGLGVALATGTAHADSTPLGKGVDKLVGNTKKVTGSVVKKKAPAARPKAVRKPTRRPAAKPAKRVVRSSRPQARPTRVAPKPRVRISPPARKKAVSPARSTIKRSRPATVNRKAPAKIDKRAAKKIDKPAAKKIDKPRKDIDKPRKKVAGAATKIERPKPMPKPVPADPAAIRLIDVEPPALELPNLVLPSIEPPALELPPVKLPAGVTPPGQVPTAPPAASGPPLMWSVPNGVQSGTSSADPPVSRGLDHVRVGPVEVETPALAAMTPVRVPTGGLAAALLRSIAKFADETLAGVPPTSVGPSVALILSVAIGAAASSSVSRHASGWGGVALLLAALHLCAVGVGRRYSAALRLSAWRIGFRPAFAPD